MVPGLYTGGGTGRCVRGHGCIQLYGLYLHTYIHVCSQGSAVLGIQHSCTLASVQLVLCWCICCYSVGPYNQLIVLTRLYSFIQTDRQRERCPSLSVTNAHPSLSQIPLPLCHKCPSLSVTSAPPSLSKLPLSLCHKCPSLSVTSAPPSLSQLPLPLCHNCPSLSVTTAPPPSSQLPLPRMPLPSGRALFAGSSTLNQIERIIHFLPPPTRGDMDSLKSPYAQSLLRQVPRR